MATFDDYLDELQQGAKKLAAGLVDGLQADALSDMNAFLKRSERDLARWTKQLAEGEITTQDFDDFVQGKKALAEMHKLTKAGVAAAKL
ncbi:MAG: hypothetical protein M0Z60_02205, partial [Nitrospiraceae bacterium]|nr:hypothetical protein [Nitrospiraceae bacterium]